MTDRESITEIIKTIFAGKYYIQHDDSSCTVFILSGGFLKGILLYNDHVLFKLDQYRFSCEYEYLEYIHETDLNSTCTHRFRDTRSGSEAIIYDVQDVNKKSKRLLVF